MLEKRWHAMSFQENKYKIPIILTIFLVFIFTPVIASDSSVFSGQFVDRAISDDGTLTLKSTENSTIYLFEKGINVSTWSYKIHGNIWSAAISGNGKFIAVGSDGGLIWLFDQKGAVVWNKTFGNAGIKSIVFSKDSIYLDASNFMNQAFYLTIDGNPATRSITPTASEIPSVTPVVTLAQIPINPDLSWMVLFFQNNLNLLFGIIIGLCLAGIVWYIVSRRGYRQGGKIEFSRDIITLKNFTIFSILLVLAGFLPSYYPLSNYVGLFKTAFEIGVICFLLAYFLYAVKCWGAANQIGAVLMVSVPLLVYSLATSKIPDSTTNILIYLGILFCIYTVISVIVLYVSERVKTGLEGIFFRKNRYSHYFDPHVTYIIIGVILVSFVAVNFGSAAIFSDNSNFITGSIQKTSSQINGNSNGQVLSPTTTLQNTPTIATADPGIINKIQQAINPEPDISSMEQRIHDLINQQRTSHGLSALRFDSSLSAVARKHSADMAKNIFFAHINLQGLDPSDRASQTGYSCYKNYGSYYTTGIAENIFQTHHSTTYNGITVNDLESSETIVQSTVTSWMNSPGHRQNILTSTYDSEGIGVAISSDKIVYVTEDFC
jgi:uncharacterized protein YkwD